MQKKIIITETQLNSLINELTVKEIDDACKDINTSPSDAQISASNYKMGHVRVRGFDITIENPVGSKRFYGKNKKKYNVMKNHYGYFTKSKGKDGDQVDVFIGPDIEKFEKVYVVDQKIDGKFDESKVMFGFSSKKEAKAAYFANFDKNWHGFMHITGVSLATFRKWLYRGRKQRQPFADYVEIQKKKLNEEREMRALEDIENDLAWERVSRNRGTEMNFMNKNTGDLLSPEWFNWCGDMYDGIAVVKNNEGDYNYLKSDGSLMFPEWYYDCEEFVDGKGRVIRNGEEGREVNFVNKNGNFLGEWEKDF